MTVRAPFLMAGVIFLLEADPDHHSGLDGAILHVAGRSQMGPRIVVRVLGSYRWGLVQVNVSVADILVVSEDVDDRHQGHMSLCRVEPSIHGRGI